MRGAAALVIVVAAVVAATNAASAQPGDWGVRRDPFDVGTVNRVKAILARDPHDEGALRQLSAMYRQHRTLAKLEAEYRAQLEKGEDWATLVVLARMQVQDAPVLWKRAVAVKADDARAWIAIGDGAKTDAAAASEAYARAVKAAVGPKQKKDALVKLVGASRDVGATDAAYAELIALSPKDGKLWSDRGNALLVAKLWERARVSFVAAEGLFATDPERRLTAMTSQGIALEGDGKPDEAIAQYEKTLEKVPRGLFLREEIVLRIVEVERKRARLPALIDKLQGKWPENKRGHFEWALLGDLKLETFQEDAAIEAYKRAAKAAPSEVATQQKLIKLLDKAGKADEALAQTEAAAKAAPGDASIQLDLAKRYRGAMQTAKGLAVLSSLAWRFVENVSVRGQIAQIYEDWNEPKKAIGEYEVIARLEPDEPDHAILLGEAYWRDDQVDKAKAAWNRLDKIGTANAYFRHGDVLSLHDQWEPAVEAYTKSLAKNAANSDALYGRARGYEELQKYEDATADARRAVALTHASPMDAGLRNRTLLVRVLGKQTALLKSVERWRFAFDHGDIGAGYLLAAHHARIQSDQQHGVLIELYRRAPNDDALGVALSRSYVHKHEFDKARAELEKIALRTPARAKEIAEMIERVNEEKARVEREIRLAEEGSRASAAKVPDINGRDSRVGFRFELGTDMLGTSGALFGGGVYRAKRVARGTAWVWRIDWMKRDDEMLEQKILAAGLGITTRLIDARRFELAAGLGGNAELRYGDDVPNLDWDRGGLGGDVEIDVIPRATSAVLGLRFHRSFTDPSRGSTLFVELGVEIR